MNVKVCVYNLVYIIRKKMMTNFLSIKVGFFELKMDDRLILRQLTNA